MSVHFQPGFDRTHFVQATAPSDLGRVRVGVLWTDTTANLLKRCTSISPVTFVSIEGGGGGGYATVQDEASGLTQRTTINFTGAGVVATDDAGNSRTNVTISGNAGPPGYPRLFLLMGS